MLNQVNQTLEYIRKPFEEALLRRELERSDAFAYLSQVTMRLDPSVIRPEVKPGGDISHVEYKAQAISNVQTETSNSPVVIQTVKEMAEQRAAEELALKRLEVAEAHHAINS